MSACAGVGGGSGSATAAALQFFAAAQCLLLEPGMQQAALLNGSRVEYVVVGGGTAGSALAARLAERSRAVLLVEAGGEPPLDAVIPGFRDHLKSGRYNWDFTTNDDGVSSQGLQGGRQRQPRGRLLGGTGVINDMVYARGFPLDYDEWAETLGDDWNWTSVLQYFKKTEKMTDENIVGDPELMKYHNIHGDIEVSGSITTSYTTKMFLEAFEELGWKIVNDMTNPIEIGAGKFSHTIRNGRRDSSLTALLYKARAFPNLFVIKDSYVTKVLIENNTAVGIEVFSNNEYLNFYADKEVIISAGTFNTPKLLMLSGIGPKDHLESMDIEVIKDLPVGENLHDHVMVLLHMAARNGTCTSSTAENHMEMIKYLYDQSGSLSRSDSMGAYLAKEDSPNINVPDFAVYPSCMPVNNSFYDDCINVIGYNSDMCAKIDKINRKFEIITLAVVLLKPKSRGKVLLRSRDPFDDPLIYSGTFSNEEDLEGFPEVFEKVMSLVYTSYFLKKEASIIDVPLESCDGESGAAFLKCKARALATSAWHAVGTAPMGSVLDGQLRVHGVVGLRVADASAMPQVPRGNTNAPVVMIAEKAADYIINDI